MKKLLLILVLAVMCGSVARADNYEDGVKAFKKGDYATALKLFRPLAEKGNEGAQFNVGMMHYNGKGVIQDYKEAAKWYHLSAEKGVVRAQYNLGVMYDKGQGVIQDYKESANYEDGVEAFKNGDYAIALKLFRPLAEKGVVRAQYNLGVMYDKGQGVIQDYVLAHMWYNISASNGNDDGRHNRDSIAKEMTPAQIYKAKNMARECVKKNYKNCD